MIVGLWLLLTVAGLCTGDLLPAQVSREYQVRLMPGLFGVVQPRAEGVAQLLRFLEDVEDNQLGKGVFSYRKGSAVTLDEPQETAQLEDPGDTFKTNFTFDVRFRKLGRLTDLTIKHDVKEGFQPILFAPRSVFFSFFVPSPGSPLPWPTGPGPLSVPTALKGRCSHWQC